MIIEKIFHTALTNPEKQAIVFQEKNISYVSLQNEILKRGNIYKNQIPNKNVILSKSSNYENLIDFLALISIGKVGVFFSKQIQEEYLFQLKVNINGFILDENFDCSIHIFENDFAFFQAKNQDHFLGVLTSGTESIPKIIWKDYQSWISAFSYQSQVFGIDENDRLFVLETLNYSANLNSVLHILWQGGTAVLATLKSASNWVEQMEENQITSVFMVPSHYRLLLKINCKILNIKSLVSAGEKLDFKTAKDLMQNFKDTKLTEYYGAAELGHISFHQNQDILDFCYTVGKPFPEVKIEIIDQKIFVESPYISPDFRGIKTVMDFGYLENERLVVLGRAGRMFNKNGLNIFAEEIENKVKEIDFVGEVAALGKRRKDGSDDIFIAFTSLNFDSKSNTKNIKKYLQQSLIPSKQPKKILQIKKMPYKEIGKIDFEAVSLFFE